METNDETNNANEHNMVKYPHWQEADQLAIYKRYLQMWPRSWTGVYQETTPAKWSEWDSSLWPPDSKPGALTSLKQSRTKRQLVDSWPSVNQMICMSYQDVA